MTKGAREPEEEDPGAHPPPAAYRPPDHLFGEDVRDAIDRLRRQGFFKKVPPGQGYVYTSCEAEVVNRGDVPLLVIVLEETE